MAFFEADQSRRVIARTEFDNDAVLSTVFLCLDHNHSGHGDPILYESLWFGGGSYDGKMRRYRTKQQALFGHEQMVKEYLAEQNGGIITGAKTTK